MDVIKDDKDTDDANENSKKSKAESVEQITCNGVPLVKLAEEEYVYDVYTMQSDAMSSTGTESDQDTFNADFDAMDIVDISFLDCRDLNVGKYFISSTKILKNSYNPYYLLKLFYKMYSR